MSRYTDKLAVLSENPEDQSSSQRLSLSLGVPMVTGQDEAKAGSWPFFLAYRQGCLMLLDRQTLKKGGLTVEVDPRPGEQASYPAPKKDTLAQALGKKTRTIVDATTGWAQDSLAMFRMGYEISCFERSPVMAVLIQDGFDRLSVKPWMISRELKPPVLYSGNSIECLGQLQERPECIYLDPMFPPKRKKSALPKKSMVVLRDLLGDDEDREVLFESAFQVATKRVVVKNPDYAEPIAGKPDQSFQGKLLRYDVYLK